MRSTTRLESACAICRSRWTSCGGDVVAITAVKALSPSWNHPIPTPMQVNPAILTFKQRFVSYSGIRSWHDTVPDSRVWNSPGRAQGKIEEVRPVLGSSGHRDAHQHIERDSGDDPGEDHIERTAPAAEPAGDISAGQAAEHAAGEEHHGKPPIDQARGRVVQGRGG